MAYTTGLSHRTDLVERALAYGASLLEAAAHKHAERRIYRETLGELRRLDDRELADLGLSRSMLKGIALEAAQKAANG
ncbi:MAG: DUF1127 domain-containing protein [Pseudomonadota bacterium]